MTNYLALDDFFVKSGNVDKINITNGKLNGDIVNGNLSFALVSKKEFIFPENIALEITFKVKSCARCLLPTVYKDDDVEVKLVNDNNIYVKHGSEEQFLPVNSPRVFANNNLVFIQDGQQIKNIKGDTGITSAMIVKANGDYLGYVTEENPNKIVISDKEKVYGDKIIDFAILSNGEIKVLYLEDDKLKTNFSVGKNISLADIKQLEAVGEITFILVNNSLFAIKDSDLVFVKDNVYKIYQIKNVLFIVNIDGSVSKTYNAEIIENIPNSKFIKQFGPGYQLDDDYRSLPQTERINYLTPLYIDGIFLCFGVQNPDIDESKIELSYNANGEKIPVINGSNEYTKIETIIRNIKGTTLVADRHLDKILSNANHTLAISDASFSNGKIIDASETVYKIVVAYGPFGKTINLLKLIDGDYVKVFSSLIAKEAIFTKGRLALYIGAAKEFEFIEAKITDEKDVTMLPEEVIYRDIDSAVIQTKVSEVLDKNYKLTEELSNTIEKIIDNVSKSLNNLDNRLKTLEGN